MFSSLSSLQSVVHILMQALEDKCGGKRLQIQLLTLKDEKLCKQIAHC